MFLLTPYKGNAYSCAFTGHRPAKLKFKYDEHHPLCIELKQVLENEIDIMIKNGVNRFLSGMALGIDIFCAEIVLSRKAMGNDISLVACVPYQRQAATWPGKAQQRYHNILAGCDDIIYFDSGHAVADIFTRNRYLVDNCDVLLACFDNSQTGGTAATVNYAIKRGRPVIFVNPVDLSIHHLSNQQLCFFET